MKRAMQGKAQVGFSYLPHIESYKYNNFISANQPMLPASHKHLFRTITLFRKKIAASENINSKECRRKREGV